MKKQFSILALVYLLIISCGSDSSEVTEEETIQNPVETTVAVVVAESTTTSSTTTTTLFVCLEDNNQNINFDRLKNVQNFLNRYGFEAGEEDGYLGNETIRAVKSFQAYAGLKPDGDIGPMTKEKMRNWTGCEEKVDTYIETEDESTSSSQTSPSSTTTTTTTTSTTSTTVPTQNVIYNFESNYGYLPSVSLSELEVISIFRGVENLSSICGVPYINNFELEARNLYANGNLEYSSIQNGGFSISNLTTQIIQNTANQITIEVDGNGDTNFKFYFIKPFETTITILEPSVITTSIGLTTAVFEKSELEQGFWFYSFAENNSGQIVRSSGVREFLVSDDITQTNSANNEVDSLFFTFNQQNISRGENLNDKENIKLFYTSSKIYDARNNTPNFISDSATTVTLTSESQALVGEILHIGSELMKVVSKNGKNFDVERGYLNTEKQNHAIGSSVKAIPKYSKRDVQSSFAYAVISSEEGFKYQIPLDSELSSKSLSTAGCPNGVYSFEEITIFSFRPKGSSTVYTKTLVDRNNPLFDKQFTINNSYNYSPPSINSLDQSGNFLNKGPKNTVVSKGDQLLFDFSGLDKGTNKPRFVELKFLMLPYESSKNSTRKSIFFDIDDEEYIFEIRIDNVISLSSSKSTDWESGYKYIFESIVVYDEVTKTTIKNNSEIIYDYKNEKGSHEAYYLDQFSFIVP